MSFLNKMYDKFLQKRNSLILELVNTRFHIEESIVIQDIIQSLLNYWWLIACVFVSVLVIILICRKNQQQPRKQNNQDDDFLQNQNNRIRDKTMQIQNDSQNFNPSRLDQENDALLKDYIPPQNNNQLWQPNKDEHVVEIKPDNSLPPQKQNPFDKEMEDLDQKILDIEIEQQPQIPDKVKQQQKDISEIEQQIKQEDPNSIKQKEVLHISIQIPQMDQIHSDNLQELSNSAPQNTNDQQQDIFNVENYKVQELIINPRNEEQIMQLQQINQINKVSPFQIQQTVKKPASQEQITEKSQQSPQLNQIQEEQISLKSTRLPQLDQNYQNQPPQKQQIVKNLFQDEDEVQQQTKLPQLDQNQQNLLPQYQQIVQNKIQNDQIKESSMTQLYQKQINSPPQNQQIDPTLLQDEDETQKLNQLPLKQLLVPNTILGSETQESQITLLDLKQGNAPPQKQQMDQILLQDEEYTEKLLTLPQLDQLPLKQQLVSNTILGSETQESQITQLNQKQEIAPPQKQQIDQIPLQPDYNQQDSLPQEQLKVQNQVDEQKIQQQSIIQGNVPPQKQQIDQIPLQYEEQNEQQTEKLTKLPQQDQLLMKQQLVQVTVEEDKIIKELSMTQLAQKQMNSQPKKQQIDQIPLQEDEKLIKSQQLNYKEALQNLEFQKQENTSSLIYEQMQKIDLNKLKQEQSDDKILKEGQRILKEQNENQNNLAFQILDSRLYKPSFKERQVEDEYLKKFIRDFKNIQEYLEEYNLDGSQNQQLNNQIKLFIPIRGDGNCLFTSIGFQYLYYNLIDAKRYKRLMNIIDQIEFQQNYENQSIETKEDQDILRQEFKVYLQRLIKIKNPQQQLQQIAQFINNEEGPFYGLLIIFMRNYFRKLLQDFYDTSEEKFLIQNPDQITEITTWEFMYDETDIALKVFATQEQILIKCYQKMDVDDKIVKIAEYQDEELKQFQYKIGLAFQPGHYNAILLSD